MQALSQLSYTPNEPAIIASVQAHRNIRPDRLAEFHLCVKLAEWTGLEPATPGVTGRYSNRLNYHSALTCTDLPSALHCSIVLQRI